MKFRVEVVRLDGTNQEQRHTVLTIERAELAMETLGMSLSEGKATLSGVQDIVIAQQAREYLQQQRACSDCGRLFTSKDAGTTAVKTVFGSVRVANPRWNCCVCQSEGPQTFRPMRQWLTERTSPEMLWRWLLAQDLALNDVDNRKIEQYRSTVGRCPSGTWPHRTCGLNLAVQFLIQKGIVHACTATDRVAVRLG